MMRLNWNFLIAATGLLACIAIVAVHWYEHPRKICAARSISKNLAWDGKPDQPCPPP